MFSGLLAKERESKMEGYREFDKSAEERTLEYFDFTAKVFRWVRIILIRIWIRTFLFTVWKLFKKSWISL